MWTYLQNSTLKISDNNARASLFAWKKHGTGNEELQPVWPPNNGLQPEPIQSLRARIPTAGALSLKHSHAHVHPNKSRPARCSSWAIIVCLVQLHLKWQRPRAMGRIKDCVQSNTPRTSCQRGCTAFPFSPAPPHFPLFLCSYVRHKNILSSLLSYIKTLWFLLPYTLAADRSELPPANCLSLSLSREIIFHPAPRGQSWSSLDCWWGRAKACALLPLLCIQPRTGNDIYAGLPSPSPARQTPTCHGRGRGSAFMCMYVCYEALGACRLN